MQTIKILRYLVIFLCALVSFRQSLLAECSPQARTTAEKFLNIEYRGAFIGGSKDAFQESLNLTMDNGFPPSWPVVFVTGYKITNEMAVKDGCRFSVLYKKKGWIDQKFIFRDSNHVEVATIWIICANAACKVDMDDKRFGLPPHVGREGLSIWLDKLKDGEHSEKILALQKIVSEMKD